MANLENNDIDIDMDVLETIDIDIDMDFLKNIDINKILYWLEFGISNRANFYWELHMTTKDHPKNHLGHIGSGMIFFYFQVLLAWEFLPILFPSDQRNL